MKDVEINGYTFTKDNITGGKYRFLQLEQIPGKNRDIDHHHHENVDKFFKSLGISRDTFISKFDIPWEEEMIIYFLVINKLIKKLLVTFNLYVV